MKQYSGFLGLILLMSAAPAPVVAVDLLPHRGAYRMSLASASRTSGLVGAKGVMIYQFNQSCDGWTVQNRTYLQLTYESGASADTLWTFASWESADGLDFRFRARFEEDNRVVERVQGTATLSGKGGEGMARLTHPEEAEIPLPEGTVFPTEHMIELIKAGEQGQSSLTRIVFDGASLENPYLVSAVLGPLAAADKDALETATGLPAAPSWWTRLAYFPLDSREAAPEFELGAHYRADGVSDEILQQFEDFTLRVHLDKFEVLPRPDC